MKYKVAIVGLGLGGSWALAAVNCADTELVMVYDKNFDRNPRIKPEFYKEHNVQVVDSMEAVCQSDVDIVIVTTPDHFHVEQSVMAMEAGKHVICEKPLAPTVEDCKKIIDAVKRTGKFFMTGQVCRYAPGFRMAKKLLDSGRIGELVYLECEYAHNYDRSRGFDNWRCDPAIKRENILGGGCHALDLSRWLAGEPTEVFAYTNHKFLPHFPTADTGVAVAKFKNNVLGRIFISAGVRRPYTMRTCIYGTLGTIICDNTSDHIQISEEQFIPEAGDIYFNKMPVNIASHNVTSELVDFVEALKRNEQCPTDVYQGTATVAFAEAMLKSAATGLPVSIEPVF